MNSYEELAEPPEYSVLFRESTPPGPESLAALNPIGVEHQDDGTWIAEIESVKGCFVWIQCDADPSVDLSYEIRLSSDLGDDEKAKISGCQSRWHVLIDPGPGPLLQMRKRTLVALGKLFRTIRKGLGFYNVDTFQVWSLGMLQDELMTNAALSIESLYGVHPVINQDGTRWVHTHGLASVGGFDIDLINPSDDALNVAHTLIRSLAFAAVEGSLQIGQPDFQVAYPGGNIRMISASEFDEQVGQKFKGIRVSDENHMVDRAVVCEPKSKKGLLGLGRERVEPSRFVRGAIDDNTVFSLSSTSTDIIAARAQETYPILVKSYEEFSTLDFPMLVKLACQVDSKEGSEHIWFKVHSADQNEIDATCLNQPYEVSGLNQGDRGRYEVDQITEWSIQTPIGSITPNQLSPIRRIRANREAMEEAMRQHRRESLN